MSPQGQSRRLKNSQDLETERYMEKLNEKARKKGIGHTASCKWFEKEAKSWAALVLESKM